MVATIYVEHETRRHPRAVEIMARFPRASIVDCQRYGEVFNPRAQSFRLQKAAPALILAAKHEHFLHEAPAGYGIGGASNFYFSHMLNCVYDCRYCFLQGMFRSAHYVVFVNYEDFADAIRRRLASGVEKPSHFFSGYDCDSLAFEPATGFAAYFLDFFDGLDGAWLELRSKSTQISSLLDRRPVENCVVAFSFTPEEICAALEHGVPEVERRLRAMAKLEERGWRLGLRFDPLIYSDDYRELYRRLFSTVFSTLRLESLHSVSLGSFRLPRDFFKRISKLYPEERLFAAGLEDRDGMVAYRVEVENEMLDFCGAEILRYVDRDIYFPCS